MNSSIWQRHDWRRFIRHDAHRFDPPSVQTKSFAARRIEWRRLEEEETARAAEQEEFERELLQLRWEVKKLKLDLAWRRLCSKYGYNPNQPRVPGAIPVAGSGRAEAADT
jgi:hypothetical protein